MSGVDIKAIQAAISEEITKVNSPEELENLRIKYLGRKGIIAKLTSSIPTLPLDQRAEFGREVNELKKMLTSIILDRQMRFSGETPQQLSESEVDIGMPGIAQVRGHIHPLTQIIDEICGIFMRMGFTVVDGPEIETEYNNFTGLNIPLEHPSRDAFDTFYIKNSKDAKIEGQDRLLLRSHTSPVQVRVMKSRKPPLAVIVPGRVYRPDAVDASHSFMFHQIEGLLIDTHVRFSDLKGVLEFFAKCVFGEDIKMRFRPHFFPFTEPSAEVDISCIICKGAQGSGARSKNGHCSVCAGKGWLEILGAGMVHPNVLKMAGYDTKKYTGFAFGMGIERIAMLKFGIDDIRLFFENDLRFLSQF